MGTEIKARRVDISERLHLKPEQETPKAVWTSLRALEALGLGGGVAALFAGLTLSAAGWAEEAGEGGHLLVVCGTALLLAAAALLLLGAHCLDVEEGRRRRARSGGRR